MRASGRGGGAYHLAVAFDKRRVLSGLDFVNGGIQNDKGVSESLSRPDRQVTLF